MLNEHTRSNCRSMDTPDEACDSERTIYEFFTCRLLSRKQVFCIPRRTWFSFKKKIFTIELEHRPAYGYNSCALEQKNNKNTHLALLNSPLFIC